MPKRQEFMLIPIQKNQEFYDFYRSLEAYKKSFNNKGDIMVLDADSDFFKYLRNSEKR
jgi:membrane protease subunit HflC